jgi:hypothetical protein
MISQIETYPVFIRNVLYLIYLMEMNYRSSLSENVNITAENRTTEDIFTLRAAELSDDDSSFKLDADTKDRFEHIFNTDFSSVRIHTGRYASEITRRNNAYAVTIGDDIYFAQGRYSTESEEGIRLLAHELQHVVQNSRGERLVYVEDFQNAEEEAGAIEELMNLSMLINPEGDLTKSMVPSGPDSGGSHTAPKDDHMKEPAMAKGILDNALNRISAKSQPQKYEIMLKNGKKTVLTKGELEALYAKLAEAAGIWMRERNIYQSAEENESIILSMSENTLGRR